MGIFTDTTGWQTKALWTGIAVLGAVSFAIVALNRGEAVNAAWLVVAAVCVYFIAYRFYGLFVAERALGVDGTRPTPAFRHNDGLDYVPTNRYVLYGHDLTVRTNHIDADHAFLHGPATFIYPVAQRTAPVEVALAISTMAVRSATSSVPRWGRSPARLRASASF